MESGKIKVLDMKYKDLKLMIDICKDQKKERKLPAPPIPANPFSLQKFDIN